MGSGSAPESLGAIARAKNAREPGVGVWAKSTKDPWEGARVFCHGKTHYKGRFGYMHSADRIKAMAQVMFDGMAEKVLSSVPFQYLIAV